MTAPLPGEPLPGDPSAEDPSIVAARVAAFIARERMMATVHAIQSRLSPRTIASDAWDGVRERGADLAQDAIAVANDLASEAVAVARARPAAVAAAGGVIAAFLARHKLRAAAKALFSRNKETDRASGVVLTTPYDPGDAAVRSGLGEFR